MWRTEEVCSLTHIQTDDIVMFLYQMKSFNQIIKINEFFLALELWFYIFVCHLCQSRLFVLASQDQDNNVLKL